jgi:hypothetical protein
MRDPDVADHRTGPRDAQRRRHGLPCTDAFQCGIDTDAIRHVQDGPGRRVASLGNTIRDTERKGQRLVGRVAAETDDAGGARRRAATTAHRPTAPSPTTATTAPGFTPALAAAW